MSEDSQTIYFQLVIRVPSDLAGAARNVNGYPTDYGE